MMRERAVLWDLDGTLADSREYHWRAWRETMAAEGITITEPQFLSSFGQRNDAIITAWLGPGTAPDRLHRLGETKEACYRRLVEREGLEPLPGAVDWITRLEAGGWLQAIASSAPRLNIEVMCRALRLEGRFGELISAEDVRAGKPDPEVFLVAAARLGVPPARCVVVEDAAAGIEAARRAGMRSVGVGSGRVQAADIAVPSLRDLTPDAFDGLVPS
jgi:HAD superfamily hydrolase (TIGR01509 family)